MSAHNIVHRYASCRASQGELAIYRNLRKDACVIVDKWSCEKLKNYRAYTHACLCTSVCVTCPAERDVSAVSAENVFICRTTAFISALLRGKRHKEVDKEASLKPLQL